MAYCGQATQANANYLASKTGLSPAVALAWLRNECQSVANPTNPLNIRYYGSTGQTGKIGGFATYASPHAGLDGAARLVNNSAYYAIIRAAIKTGNPWAEAHAIELSPWAGGHYGGTSTKYGHIVAALKAITSGSPPSIGSGGSGTGGTSKPPVNSDPASSGSPAPAWFNDPAHVLTQADLEQLVAYVLSNANVSNITALRSYLEGYLLHTGSTIGNGQIWTGHTVAELKAANPNLFLPHVTDSTGTGMGTDPITSVANAIGSLGDVVGKLFGFAAGLVFIVLGVFIYSKSVRSKVEQVA